MKRFICFLAALVFCSNLAQAGWNLKQNADGTAVWIDGKSVEVPIGDSGLVVSLSALQTAGTAFVVSHKKGKITKYYVTPENGVTGTSTLNIYIRSSSDTQGTFTAVSDGSTIAVTGVTPGYSYSRDITGLDNTNGGISNSIEQGDVIAIGNNGSASTGGVGVVTIVIE